MSCWQKSTVMTTGRGKPHPVVAPFAVLVGMFCILSSLHAQPDTLWVHKYDPENEIAECFDIQLLPDIGFVLGGQVFSNANSSDFAIITTDSSGNVEWVQKMVDPGSPEHPERSSSGTLGITVSDSSLYMVGEWASNSGGAGLIARMYLNGDSLWMYSYGGTRASFSASLSNQCGGIYAAGSAYAYSNNGSSDILFIDLDETGQERWHRTYGGDGGDYCWNMIRTSDGGFAFTGETSSFGNGIQFYLVKTDSLGEEEWSRAYRGPGGSVAAAIGQLPDGGYVMAGRIYVSDESTESDMLIIRVDAAGEELWQRQYGQAGRYYNEELYDLVVLPSGDIVVLGNSSDYPNNGVLMRLTSDGDLRWDERYYLIRNSWCRSLLVLEDGSYAFAGRNLNGAFMVRTAPDTTDRINSVRLLDPAFPSFTALEAPYPNPFNGRVTIGFELTAPNQVTLKVFDQRCREVVTLLTGQQRAGNYQVIWDGINSSGMPVTSGMYFVRLETPVFTKVNKMTLVK